MDGGPLAALIDRARSAERAGDWRTALSSYGEALQHADPERKADVLRWMGTVHRECGELDAAMEMYQASLAAAEPLGILRAVAAGLNCIGIVEQQRGRLEEANRSYTRAAGIAEQLGDVREGAMIAQNLATMASIHGELETALKHYAYARQCFSELHEGLPQAWVLNNMGMAYVDLNAFDPARECFAEAHLLATAEGDRMTVASIEINTAEMCLRSHDFPAARTHCDQAFELFTELKVASGVAEVDKMYGMLYRDTARPALAETHFRRAVESARATADPLLEAESLQEWALLHWELARSREAFECLNAAHAIFNELGARRELLDLDRRLAQIEEIYLRVVAAWGASIEAKDRYTAGHCDRVALYACSLAEELGITGRDLVWFRMGAFLHDVGKIEVPEEVLNKPGKLTEEEWRLMQRHTIVGDRIAAELGFPWDIGPMVRSHHERWDGGGYPDGLKGEKIPLHARILCVADVYDALTTTRSYRPALTRAEALEVMRSESGDLLDPRLFPRFEAIVTAMPEAPGPTVSAL
jgi:putative nucleotidyltransferase with HDIG domain